MGIFRAKDPHKNLYTASGGRILSRDIDETNMKYLLPIGFSPKPDNRDVIVVELKIENMSAAFKEFTETFLARFNAQFPDAAKNPVGIDYVAIPEWPNYNIAKFDRPSQIGQSQHLGQGYVGDPVSQKRTSILIFLDGNRVGKLFALRKKDGSTFLEEIMDLKVSIEDEFGMALWTISSTSPNVYSSLFLDVFWTAGNMHFDRILLGIPTRVAALPIGMALSQSGLK
jgi:hypothetical protein